MTITRDQATRIATAINVIRPDWPIASIVTIVGQHHQHRVPADVGAALAWVALDPDSRTPARINEAGPWWPTRIQAEQSHAHPPPIAPGEFAPANPVTDDRRAELIAQAREALRPTVVAPLPDEPEDVCRLHGSSARPDVCARCADLAARDNSGAGDAA